MFRNEDEEYVAESYNFGSDEETVLVGILIDLNHF